MPNKTEVISANEFRKPHVRRALSHPSVYEGKSANELTKRIMSWLDAEGHIIQRNNTMGVFDPKKAGNVISVASVALRTGRFFPKRGFDKRAAKYIYSLIAQKVKGLGEQNLVSLINYCWKKSHEKKGATDLIGCEKGTGRAIFIEIKYGKDRLSPEQKFYLDRARRCGAIAFAAHSFKDFLEKWEELRKPIN